MTTFLKAFLPFAAAILVYALWIRPKIKTLPHIQAFYVQADGLWQRIMIWVRVQWDALVAGLLLLWPYLPDVLQQISGLDLSALIPSDWTKMINQGIGLALVVLRAMNLAATKKQG